MRKMQCWLFACMVLVSISVGTCAGAKEDSPTIGYAVRAIIPENQIDELATFFDIKVKPGGQQVLKVTVMNRGSEPIEVAVEANTAFTNENGTIECAASTERDPSLAVDFSQIVVPVLPVITVPAHGEATAEFVLTVPEEPFEGTLLGGLMFTKLNQEQTDKVEGIVIQNVYRYVIGVYIRESLEPIAPDFVFEGVSFGQEEYQAITVQMRNPQPLLVRGMKVCMDVFPQGGGEAVLSIEREGIAMAPNSAMPFKVSLINETPLRPGTYRAAVTVWYEENAWQYDTLFTVEKAPAR